MRKRLSPGIILGIFAVVIACTGSATAGALITSGKIQDGTIQGRDIKKGTITSDRLASNLRKQMSDAGKPGPAGAKGEKGDTGSTGATLQGSAPQPGEKGDTGAAGKDGLNGANPATLVAASGDAGWGFTGGGGTLPYPTASFSGGQLRLQGGFDGSTTAGAIGISHAYDRLPLSSLKALSYDFRVLKRPAGPNINAPSIHVTLSGASTGQGTGFANLVFEPYNQDGKDFADNQLYSLDALAGEWWATRKIGAIERQQEVSWTTMMNANPDAVIVGISIDNGGTSGDDTVKAEDFAADVDNVIVGFGSSFTRYDFGG